MKIVTNNIGHDAFEVSFDDLTVTLTAQDMKILVAQVTQALAPPSGAAQATHGQNQRLLVRIKEASDVDMQVFIQAADHDDMVALLKSVEDNNQLRQKLFRNMSENSRKMFLEDVEFRFKDAVPDGELAGSLKRLSRAADELRSNGRADL